MTNIKNNSWNFYNSACNHFLAAWEGRTERKAPKISPFGRFVHLAQSAVLMVPPIALGTIRAVSPIAQRGIHLVTPLVTQVTERISSYVARFFTDLPPPIERATNRIDREYKLVEAKDVSDKLEKERRRALISMDIEQEKPGFENQTAPADNALFFRKEPKLNHDGANIGVDMAWMQGRRPKMEDEHLAQSFSIKVGCKNYPVSVFGVFDGHGGPEASKFLKDNLVTYLEKHLEKKKALSDAAIFNGLKLAFVDLDHGFKGNDGSTACIGLLLNGNLWVSNAGDARAVLNNGGKPVQLSDDAKPDVERFKKRIEKRGGKIVYRLLHPPRVNGNLAVASGIGDHRMIGKLGFKCITPRPKITKTPLSEISPNSKLIIACDGLWDVCSSKQAVNSGFTARGLMHAAYNAGSKDNISVMTVDIPGKKAPFPT